LFYETVTDFMRVNHTDPVAIEKRAGKGRFARGSDTFKMEALQVMKACEVGLHAPAPLPQKTRA
jgi:hypothetical protein